MSTNVFATSVCEELYQAELKIISSKVDHKTNVGDGVYVNPHTGGLGYNPGFQVTSLGDNWARDFLYAVKYGSEITFGSKKTPRKEFLKDFSKVLNKKCKLKPDPEFKNLRVLLKSLLDDKSFCPEGQILKPSFFGNYKKFHQVALRNFPESDDFGLCDETVVKDDSNRSVKDVSSLSIKERRNSRAEKN